MGLCINYLLNSIAVIVLALMVWIVKRVRTTIQSPEPNHPSAVEPGTLEMGPSGTIQVLQQPLMMTVMDTGEFKQALELELDHYVLA